MHHHIYFINIFIDIPYFSADKPVTYSHLCCLLFLLKLIKLVQAGDCVVIVVCSISGSNIQISEKDRLDQEILDIKCLQLLRGLIHNETVILPDDWELNIKTNAR